MKMGFNHMIFFEQGLLGMILPGFSGTEILKVVNSFYSARFDVRQVGDMKAKICQNYSWLHKPIARHESLLKF